MSSIEHVAVDRMAFAPEWTVDRLAAQETGPAGRWTFLVPPGQHRLHAELTEGFPDAVVRRLDAATLTDLAAAEHLVFVSRTSWADGIPDADVAAFLALVQALDSRSRVSLDVVTDKAVPSPLFPSATHAVDGVYVGMAQTLAHERPEWTVRCLCLHDLTAATLSRVLGRALPEAPGKPVCVRDEEYAVPTLAPAPLGAWPERSVFRRGGTYVILGGTGGLGGVLAEYLAATYQAELVLVGRRVPEETAALRGRLRELGASGVHYHQVDLTDGPSLQRAIDSHDVINGVVHSALVLEDATLATMTESTLFDVLRPKLHGTRNLVRALRGRDIDFCLFFSSIQSYLASPGQANYAAACVAKDAYADLLRNALLINSKVVNWGFWGSVGVVATPAYRERMARLGIGSIEPEEGLAAIERFLASDHRQLTFVKGTREALERMDITPHEAATGTEQEARNHELADRLAAYTRWRLDQVPLPRRAVAKHEKLLAAIQAIPSAESPPRPELLAAYPELTGHVALLDRCLDHLADVLAGTTDPLDVLFPGGSFELVAPVYQSNPIADHFNRISAQVVANQQRLAGDRPLRVLEVGAGTGSTTRFVLEQLDSNRTSYHFTDLSYAFLNKARDSFAGYPFVEYEICDVERPPAAYAESFDVVVATNVLHATSDVPNTLRNVRGMLRQGGILVLSEITARQDYATLTFGLTDGWWHGDDSYRIEHSPLLSGDRWRELMTEAGFGAVRSHGGDEQQVMVAPAGSAAVEPAVADTVRSHKELEAPPAEEDGSELRTRVEEFVRGVIAETMRFDLSEVERDKPFRDMGIDSLISMELMKPLRERVGYLPATVLFEFPTVERLAEHLLTDHDEPVRAAFAAPATEPRVVPAPREPQPREVPAPQETLKPGDIAVVGIAARLPKARDVNGFWQNLLDGVDCTSVVPAERWHERVTEGPEPLSYTDRGAFVDDIDAFDHTFFNLTPGDAAAMDPQERLLLEQTYQALLDAGYSRSRLAGSDTGVFVGVMNGGYAWHTVTDRAAAPPTSLFWSMANRASYHFDWHGPSMAVDTACSASLTALHLACQSLRAGECDRAVVGGVNLITHPRQYQLLSRLGMLSPTGQCRPFGAGADGFVDGEGVVSLVLRPAQDAVRDQDRVYAIIEGSSVNAGGRANGYTAPNAEAQHGVITKALAAAGTSPEEVGYVEAHGTGTELGDPIELRALSKAYAAAGTQRIRLGSVKSNVGHLESAAGLTGVLKAVLQMRHGHLVASLHAERTNPHLDFTATPFVLTTAGERWPASLPKVSAVSSFGAGGANAHVVLRGVPETAPEAGQARDSYVIPLSHHSIAGLQLSMDRLAGWLRERRVDMDALAYSLACRRDTFRHRVAIVCRDQDELVRELELDLARRRPRQAPAGQVPAVLSASTAADVAARYEAGADLDWTRYYAPHRPMSLPEHVFLRHRHWVDAEESAFGDQSSLVSAHRIDGEAMAPAAWALSVLTEEARGRSLANVLWQKKITAPEMVEVRAQGSELALVDQISGEEYCTADVVAPAAITAPAAVPPAGARRRHAPELYADFRRLGYDYGEPLRGVRWAEVGQDSVRAFLHVDQDWGHDLSPALLDAGMQLAILLAGQEPGAPLSVPYHLGRLTVVRLPRDEAVFCHCVARSAGRAARTRTFDFFFTDAAGEVLFALEESVSVAVDDGGATRERPSSFTVLELN